MAGIAAALVGSILGLLAQPTTAGAAVSATISAPRITQQHPLDCEAAALQIALAAIGVNITQNWALSQFGADLRPAVLGSNGAPVEWGDPYQSFVGNVNGSETTWTGYGVYYPPVVRAARAAGVIAEGHEGWAPQQLYDAVAQGDPVIVWAPHLMEQTTVGYWTTWSGSQVWYAQGEHTQVLVGYDLAAGTVTLDDPWDGLFHTYSMTLFEQRFAYWFSSAVVIERGVTVHPVSLASGAQELVWRGADGDLWAQSYDGGSWGAPTDTGIVGLASDPHPVVWNGSVEVVWRGEDGNLWGTIDQGGWQAPQMLSQGPIEGDPQPVAWGTRELDVFWQGPGGSLVHAWTSSAGGWSGPQTLVSSGLASDPMPVAAPDSTTTVVAAGTGPIDVFWSGLDGSLWHEWFDGQWNGPVSLGGHLASDPHPVAGMLGSVVVLWQGTDGTLWADSWASRWSGPQQLTTAMLGGAPQPVALDSSIDVLWRGTDGNLWHDLWDNGWTGAALVGDGPLESDPQPVATEGIEDVFWGGTYQGIYLAQNLPWSMSQQRVLGSGGPSWTGPLRLGTAG